MAVNSIQVMLYLLLMRWPCPCKKAAAYLLNHALPIDSMEYQHDQEVFQEFRSQRCGMDLHHVAGRRAEQPVKDPNEGGAKKATFHSMSLTVLDYAHYWNQTDIVSIL